VVESDGARRARPIPVVDRIADADVHAGDTVVLAMKSQDTEAAVRELAAAAPADVTLACVQNGVENERVAARRFPNVYGVVVLCPAVHLDPGVVVSNASPLTGLLDLGRYPHGSDARAHELAGALRGASYGSEVRDDVMAWKWAKLLGNLGNALIALAGREAADSAALRLVRDEARSVLAAAGIDAPVEALAERGAQLARRLEGRSGNSSWQSLERGTASIETDYLNGEIVLLARLQGIDAPANAAVQELARELVERGGPPGSFPLDALERALGAAVAQGSRVGQRGQRLGEAERLGPPPRRP
jgi:2-dehydropantoate 2-reductase